MQEQSLRVFQPYHVNFRFLVKNKRLSQIQVKYSDLVTEDWHTQSDFSNTPITREAVFGWLLIFIRKDPHSFRNFVRELDKTAEEYKMAKLVIEIRTQELEDEIRTLKNI